MKKLNYIIAASQNMYNDLGSELSKLTSARFYTVNTMQELEALDLINLQPRYIFFPHWSWVIPEQIYIAQECVIFHMTDLPFGRGGSPMQNLISRKIYDTKITALRCSKELDAGPVYLKEPLGLYGNAEEILLRAKDIIKNMINTLIVSNPIPVPQEGEPTYFKRRKQFESELKDENDLMALYDKIRMLDGAGYPPSFIDFKNFRFEFSRASLKSESIMADVRITQIKKT